MLPRCGRRSPLGTAEPEGSSSGMEVGGFASGASGLPPPSGGEQKDRLAAGDGDSAWIYPLLMGSDSFPPGIPLAVTAC